MLGFDPRHILQHWEKDTLETDQWTGCYPSKWKGIITPEAFQHPAKFSSKLIERIYLHAVDDMHWLAPGDRVVDPFGGVALGAYPALRYGLDWVGCELEYRFVGLGSENIDLWNATYRGKLSRWGSARLIQGDSRNLESVIHQATSVISSPPYTDGCAHTGGDNEPGKLIGETYHGVGIDGIVSSPPYVGSLKHSNGIDADKIKKPGGLHSQSVTDPRYGSSDGQLGAMPAGDWQAAISSPPFIQTQGGCNVTSTKGPLSDPLLIKRHSAGNQSANAYGTSDGQLSELHPGDYKAAISSPPFEDMVTTKYQKYVLEKRLFGDYGSSAGQLGQDHREIFWTAARTIIEQTYQVLAPGGHAIWVVKGYVKKKQLVDFPGQWREVCEACGFTTLHEHHAMLVTHHGTSLTLDGGEVEHKTESKSFFRRLAEKNGSPHIDYETVLCMEKPS